MVAALSQRPRHDVEEAVDRRIVVIATEAESQPPVAAIDDDVVHREALVSLLGAVDVEGEEVAARIARWGNEVPGGKRLEVEPLEPGEEALMQAAGMRVDVGDRGA